MQTARPLVQIATRDGIVLGGRSARRGSGRVCRRRWLCCRTTGRGRRLLRFRACLSLPVSDIILIAWGTGPRWHIGRLASGPVRPGIGNGAGKLGAGPDSKAEAERQQRQSVPVEYHATRWIVP
jgi:hypothetical protein